MYACLKSSISSSPFQNDCRYNIVNFIWFWRNHCFWTLITIAWAVSMCRLPLGITCYQTPDNMAQRCFLSQKVTGIIFSQWRKELLVVRNGFRRYLLLKKPFLVSAHKLSYFLSGRHELRAWLNCTTFIISFFWWSILLGPRENWIRLEKRQLPTMAPNMKGAELMCCTRPSNTTQLRITTWHFTWEAEVVLEHWYLDELLWSVLTWLCWRQKKRNVFLRYKASAFPSSPKSLPLDFKQKRPFILQKELSWGENLFILLASIKLITKKI